MIKIITRITILYILIGYWAAFIIAPYSTKELEIFQFKDWLILVWGGLFIFSVFFMWAHFFHHWGMKEFKNPNVKRIWFWVILLGGPLYFIGPLIYYILVYEMGKGLKE